MGKRQKTIIFLSLFVVTIGHKANYRKIKKLEAKFDELQEDQDALYETVMDMESNFTEMILALADTPAGQRNGVILANHLGITDDEERNHGKSLEARLINLEGKFDTVMNYLMGKKRNDIKLTKTATNLVKDGKESVESAKKIANEMENQVADSLKDLIEMIQDVNNSRTLSNSAEDRVMLIGGVGAACSDESDDCYLENTTCRQGRCQCDAGLSFNGAENKCVKSCKNYGRTFQSVQKRIIRGHNDETIENISLKQCRDACVQATKFVCRSLDYFTRWKTCYLSTKTMSDVDLKDWEYNSAGIHFQRDCQ